MIVLKNNLKNNLQKFLQIDLIHKKKDKIKKDIEVRNLSFVGNPKQKSLNKLTSGKVLIILIIIFG